MFSFSILCIKSENVKSNKPTELLQRFPLAVGARDFPPLPADPLPAGRDSGGSERRQQHSGETGQEQTAGSDLRERREAGPGAQGRQIRGVLRSHTGEPGYHGYGNAEIIRRI